MSELVDYYQYDPVPIRIPDLEHNGFILDVGGGGEGVIGQIFGQEVIAIDLRRSELEEAKDGPLKIIMDAMEMQFLEKSFNNATAFFSMMYIRKMEDQQKIFQEIWRVLKPGGRLDIWDIDLSQQPDTDKDRYIVFIQYFVGDKDIGTGYGQRWPEEPRGADYYVNLASQAKFKHLSTKKNKHTFHLKFEKELN